MAGALMPLGHTVQYKVQLPEASPVAKLQVPSPAGLNQRHGAGA